MGPPILLWLAAVLQGQLKPETREFDVLSPSGGARLHVVNRSRIAPPGEVDACLFSGTSTLSLALEGRALWSADFTFAVHELRVGDDGRAGGIGISEGPQSNFSTASLFLLSTQGRLVREERLGESQLGRDGAGCVQAPLGILLDDAHQRFVARVWRVDLEREEWRVWDAVTGAASGWSPSIETDGSLAFGACSTAAEAVPGTPFTLVHAWSRAARPGLFEASYVLLDERGRLFWRLAVPEDHAERVDAGPLSASPGIVQVGERSFRVRLFHAAQCARFELVRDDAQAWSVRETARGPWPERQEPR